MRAGYQATSWAWKWLPVRPAVFLCWRYLNGEIVAVWVPPPPRGDA